jgi:hypothetical protein
MLNQYARNDIPEIDMTVMSWLKRCVRNDIPDMSTYARNVMLGMSC